MFVPKDDVHTRALSLMANYKVRGWICLDFGLYYQEYIIKNTIIKNTNAAAKTVDHKLLLHRIGLHETC